MQQDNSAYSTTGQTISSPKHFFFPIIHTQRRICDLLNFLKYASEDRDSTGELTL